ncbi:putative phage abortive infection protein [Cronobacter turicensis]|uniref:putative phage abortive infection protein n=1 Tax=Cronobacter turicensis TaxID=413502 RepID=UPI0024C28FC0|nr:putative phage abortive infection protein [Cronobacter turicensis]MDK1234414.1 putative phage abortive infection protein [Cronobacter turicensis]
MATLSSRTCNPDSGLGENGSQRAPVFFEKDLSSYQNYLSKILGIGYKMFRALMMISIGLAISYGYSYVLTNDIWLFEGMTLEEKGGFGDSWGAFTSIFSALGFCGVLWTIKLQMDATKKIEKDSRNRFESEKLRDFENSFFNMLTILQTIIKDMNVPAGRNTISREGRAVFTYHYRRFKVYCETEYEIEEIKHINDKEFSLQTDIYLCAERFQKYFKRRSSNFSHYYRYLYNLFKFIDESSIDDSSKKKYANILRAQISNYELMMLYYNGISKHGLKFRSYIEEYSLFDNLPVDRLISDVHVLFYDAKAWGENVDALSLIELAKLKKLI